MSAQARIYIETLSYWICATGATRGRLFDSVCVRDDEGLPFVPGRHLRGLLRDAVSALPSGAARASALFGPRGEAGTAYGSILRVSNAHVVSQLPRFETPARRDAAYFGTVQSTAIDERTGAAREKSLRTYEVASPTVLVATIEADGVAFDANGGRVESGDWLTTIRAALPLVRAIGAHRTRGFGRAALTIEHSDIASAA